MPIEVRLRGDEGKDWVCIVKIRQEVDEGDVVDVGPLEIIDIPSANEMTHRELDKPQKCSLDRKSTIQRR